MTDNGSADGEEAAAESEQSSEASEAEMTAEDGATETVSEAVLDIESVEEREQRIEELRGTIEEQAQQIDELEDMLLDLSARVADGDGTGVCPDCHGPVVKRNPWFRSARVKCTQCGRVFHEY
ncbi:mediator of RNA polymerase II transcription subunit 9 [Halorientalis litorea]|jgi:hypothetical protein|uniref:mediator of RNA polymerase II transcription subunit 9 n=1 Tax=Halorientalis litorea TaxID=2931977 RepID=UPI001FF577F3|nr:mediator of RNA polymerase II transcription subunit 9 [Halorientalis litorea]